MRQPSITKRGSVQLLSHLKVSQSINTITFRQTLSQSDFGKKSIIRRSESNIYPPNFVSASKLYLYPNPADLSSDFRMAVNEKTYQFALKKEECKLFRLIRQLQGNSNTLLASESDSKL